MSKKNAGWIANSADPDQTPHHAASNLGLHCLSRPICHSGQILRVNSVMLLLFDAEKKLNRGIMKKVCRMLYVTNKSLDCTSAHLSLGNVQILHMPSFHRWHKKVLAGLTLKFAFSTT